MFVLEVGAFEVVLVGVLQVKTPLQWTEVLQACQGRDLGWVKKKNTKKLSFSLAINKGLISHCMIMKIIEKGPITLALIEDEIGFLCPW